MPTRARRRGNEIFKMFVRRGVERLLIETSVITFQYQFLQVILPTFHIKRNVRIRGATICEDF